MKACEACGEAFEFERASARYCSDACSKRVRRAALPSWEWRAEPVRYRPRNLHLAQLALKRGVPLRNLVLTASERSVLVASSSVFPAELRLDAARSVARRHRWFKLTETVSAGREDALADEVMNVTFAIVDVLENAHEEISVFGATGKGRPRRVAPYAPAEEPWSILIKDFLPRELGKRLRAHRDHLNASAVSLDEQVETENADLALVELVALEEALEAEDHRTRRHARGTVLGYARNQALSPISRMEDEWGYEKHPLELRLASGRLSNPDVPFWMLEEMRREIHEWPYQPPLRGYEIEEQPWRAAPERDQARREARERSDRPMQTTMPAEELAERLTRLECKLNEALNGIAETCDRLRDRWPERGDLSDAIDGLLEAMSG